MPMIIYKWLSLMDGRSKSFGPLNDWRFCSQNVRQFLKGWGVVGTQKPEKLNATFWIRLGPLICLLIPLGLIPWAGSIAMTLRRTWSLFINRKKSIATTWSSQLDFERCREHGLFSCLGEWPSPSLLHFSPPH